MASELSFNTAIFGAASAWIKKGGGAGSGGACQVGEETSLGAQHQHEKKGTGAGKRAGLGLVAKKKDEDDAKKGIKPLHGALQKILAGTHKRARQEAEEKVQSAQAANDDDDIGELEPESKVRAFKVSKSGPEKEEKQPSLSEGKKKKKKQKQRKNGLKPVEGEVSKEEGAATKAPKKQTSMPEGNKSKEAKPTAAPRHEAAPPSQETSRQNGQREGEKEGVDRKGGGEKTRKRTKTRSKQKNIRRDKRSMEQRPEHLRGGEGQRMLTDETKKRLGFS